MSSQHASFIPREARPYQGRGAGVVSRTVASVIDATVVCGIVLLGYAGLNGARFLADPRGFQVVTVSSVLTVTTGLIVLVVYLTVAWSTAGRTYGCHLMGLRVLSRGGTRVRAPIALTRALLCALFPLGLFWCAFDATRRSIHDLLLKTSVVYDWSGGARGQGESLQGGDMTGGPCRVAGRSHETTHV